MSTIRISKGNWELSLAAVGLADIAGAALVAQQSAAQNRRNRAGHPPEPSATQVLQPLAPGDTVEAVFSLFSSEEGGGPVLRPSCEFDGICNSSIVSSDHSLKKPG